MCDTVVVRRAGGTWFAKNSDREPGEPQAVRVVRPPRDGGSGRLRATWIEVDAPPRRLAAVLSQPVWMWGAEMGVNEAGVAIGNEAIFSRARTREPGLLGMDLLRLGLECGDTARGAVEVLTALLEAHGQGGRAGYHDARFHYDNSFLVADTSDAWQLETSGRQWVARRVTDQQGISNGLSIGADHDLAADSVPAAVDAAREWDTALMPRLAGARSRATATTRAASRLGPSPSLGQLAAILRQHRDPDGDPVHGSNRDVCMHAMGPVRRSQTTGSLVAHLHPDGPRVAVTGASAPCLSAFRPVELTDPTSSGVTDPDHWYRHERVHRRVLLDADLRRRVRDLVTAAEPEVLAAIEGGETSTAEAAARDLERRRLAVGADTDAPPARPGRPAGWYWAWRDRRDGVPA